MVKNSEISLYVDSLIFETIVSDPYILKKADVGFGGGMIDAIKGYFSSHINPNDTAGSFLNLIAPGAILVTFATMGMPLIGTLLGLAFSVFHIDVAGILKSIYDSIKAIISGGGQATSAQIDSIVSQAVSTGTGPATPEEAAAAQQKLQMQGGSFETPTFLANDGKTRSVSAELKHAKLLKIAMIEYENSFKKNAGLGDFFNIFSSKKAGTSNILIRILSFFFKIALASAGLMVAGDLINKMIGRDTPATPSSAPSGSSSGSSSSSGRGAIPAGMSTVTTVSSTQNKFPLNQSYRDISMPEGRWRENYPSNRAGIENMVLDFANQVYSGLDGKDDLIRSSPGFKAVVDIILFNNTDHIGHSITFVPNIYHSKKQIVDTFIDDVARRA